VSKILVNNSGIDVVLVDVGVTVQPADPYTIPPEDYARFSASSDTIRALSNESLVLNDGGNDVDVLSDAIDIIKGWPVQPIAEETEPFFLNYDEIPVGPGPHTIFEQAVGAGEELALKYVSYSCRTESKLQVLKNGDSIANLRTGAAMPMASFAFAENNICAENDFIEIILTKRSGPPDTEVGVNIQGALTVTTI
jgi:hypothetical protein